MKPARALLLSFAAVALTPVPSVSAAEIRGDHVEIVDGDTFNLGPLTIRLHGVDAPEAGQQ